MAWLEISSGRFSVMQVDNDDLLASEIARLNPAELVTCEDQLMPAGATLAGQGQKNASWYFELDSCERLLNEQYQTKDLRGFGIDALPHGPLPLKAGCLLQYIKDTVKTAVSHLQPIRHEQVDDVLLIDVNSRLCWN